MKFPLRVAVASSGLGHIRRGIESWAEDLGLALKRASIDITLFQGARTESEAWRRVLPCLRRYERPTGRLLSLTRHAGGWRYGFGSEYEIEQSTFSLSLWAAVRADYDILHAQDPVIARWMDQLNRRGLSRPKVILAHGTEEPNRVLRKYSFLQHLTPGYRDTYERERPEGQLSFAVPNFVDVNRFHPGDREAARATFGLANDALILLSVAALKKHHKRCDYLIREFAAFREQLGRPALLVLAGAREAETPEIMELGKSLLGDSVIFLEGLDRGKLAVLYQAADIFAMASLHEMMPIALLEALASGLPMSCNNKPTFQWMGGPAGELEDISEAGGLVRQWLRLADSDVRLHYAGKARAHAEATFSEPVVVSQLTEMYAEVMASQPMEKGRT